MSAAPMAELEMQAATVPTPESGEQLASYINALVEREHDYGTCVYAMSMAATAAFNYVAHRLGVTGFQASCADLDVLRRTRRLKGPFILLKAEDALYPQYDLPARLREWLEEQQGWLAEEAGKRLEDTSYADSDVIAHWERLAAVKGGVK